MKCQIKLQPSAQEELLEAFQWYEQRSPGLGRRFIEAVSERLNELSNYPERYSKRKRSFREVSTKIFPYIIIYEFFQKEKIGLQAGNFLQIENSISDLFYRRPLYLLLFSFSPVIFSLM